MPNDRPTTGSALLPGYDSLDWLAGELAVLDEQALRRALNDHQGPQAARLKVAGRPLVNFGSNDYLALASDSRLAAAATSALLSEGTGAGSSPLVTGYGESQSRLETALAAFEGTEAAIVFNSGYAANVGAITALAGPGDAIYSDQKNHASMIDGCRLSRAEVHVYAHANAQALADHLAATAGRYRRRLIITESVFSMDGDLAPLAELADLAERYECMLLVDEAHATGVFGERGRGLAEQLGVEHLVPVRVGTLSKGLGAAGGFVCGSRQLIDWLVNRSRSYIFSTALPPATCAAAIAALEVVGSEPQRRVELLRQAASLREELRRLGHDVGRSASQILPILVGGAEAAVALSGRLREAGLLVPAIRPPSVPWGESLLRVSLTAGHDRAMIDQLVAALGARS